MEISGLKPEQVTRLIETLQQRVAHCHREADSLRALPRSVAYLDGAASEAGFALQLLEIELRLPSGSLRR